MYAKNFHRVEEATDREIYEEDDEHCIANVIFNTEDLKKIVDERIIEPIKNGELVIKDEKWGKWIISEVRCPICLEYFQPDCYSTEELKECPSCGADMMKEANNEV